MGAPGNQFLVQYYRDYEAECSEKIDNINWYIYGPCDTSACPPADCDSDSLSKADADDMKNADDGSEGNFFNLGSGILIGAVGSVVLFWFGGAAMKKSQREGKSTYYVTFDSN